MSKKKKKNKLRCQGWSLTCKNGSGIGLPCMSRWWQFAKSRAYWSWLSEYLSCLQSCQPSPQAVHHMEKRHHPDAGEVEQGGDEYVWGTGIHSASLQKAADTSYIWVAEVRDGCFLKLGDYQGGITEEGIYREGGRCDLLSLKDWFIIWAQESCSSTQESWRSK